MRVLAGAAVRERRTRLLTMPTAPPVQYRSQNGGDYDEHMMLRPDLEPGEVGIHIHEEAAR